MPGNGNNPQSTVTCSGNNGVKIFQHTHNDIDSSEINVSCTAGAAEVILDERIWWSWRNRNKWQLKSGDAINTTVDVDSSFYDGDHKLRIYARANSTKCTVDFSSTDW
jgi:hypothetical protein